jgi:hypothetical protein
MIYISNDYLDCEYSEIGGFKTLKVRAKSDRVRDCRELDLHFFGGEELDWYFSHVVNVDFPANKTDPSRDIHLALRWLIGALENTTLDEGDISEFVVVIGDGIWFTPLMLRV